jgi:DNA mismatch repair protein MSH6
VCLSIKFDNIRWICHPLRTIQEINARLDAVDTLHELQGPQDTLSKSLSKLPDLERIISRIHAGSCRVKDFIHTLNAFTDIFVTNDKGDWIY